MVFRQVQEIHILWDFGIYSIMFSLSGIWAGLVDPTLRDYRQTTQETTRYVHN